MRECEAAMIEDTASRRGYAPTAAWDEGNHYEASWPSNTLKLIRALSGRPPRLLRTAGDY